ncbi:hypothetical protein JCM19233_3805 [Vibrio astriarenae]|nr:hypothetical protein JCM19233_3805 [Vibrio sp. C7]
MIDTHAHIYASEFDQDRDEVVERALLRVLAKSYSQISTSIR